MRAFVPAACMLQSAVAHNLGIKELFFSLAVTPVSQTLDLFFFCLQVMS